MLTLHTFVFAVFTVFNAGAQYVYNRQLAPIQNCATAREQILAVENAKPDSAAFTSIWSRRKSGDKVDWIPECEADGSFKIYQRSLTAGPFCVTPKGLFVHQPKSARTSSIRCECPVHVYDILALQNGKTGLLVPTCLDDGSYSPVQCRSSQLVKSGRFKSACYCADPNGRYLGDLPPYKDGSFCSKIQRTFKGKTYY
ncbi:uncharacterized protein LOC129588621 [Paramacrobiotus metropolitanus]|uniref:uncharacterized protein LOC129588621 n=1 Tax=Paramacrobiotus metropolitanus TaxID=2943436 RepID=UPI002445E22B|nr:uncharacterized protein LOC129588621 [Paramacrobiotus metropolitanus]